MQYLIDYVQNHMGGFGAALILFFLSCVEISKVKINPISDFLGFVGRKCNEDLYQKFDALEEKQNEIQVALVNTENMMRSRIADIDNLTDRKFEKFNNKIDLLVEKQDNLQRSHNESEMKASRFNIIRAADKIINGYELSDDYMEQMGEDTEIYLGYCKEHPEFKNHKGKKSLQIFLDYEDERFRRKAEENLIERRV